jgi:hypothetical protein
VEGMDVRGFAVVCRKLLTILQYMLLLIYYFMIFILASLTNSYWVISQEPFLLTMQSVMNFDFFLEIARSQIRGQNYLLPDHRSEGKTTSSRGEF